MNPLQEHFSNINGNSLKRILSRIEKITDIDKLDLMACDSEANEEGIYEFLKDKYGLILVKEEDRDAQEFKAIEEIKQNIEVQKKAFLDIIGTSEAKQGSTTEITEQIQNYSPHTERMVVSSLVAVSQSVNVINISERGHSKTHCTQGVLDMLNIPYNEIKGHITPKRFYELAKMFNGTIILIDESANMLTDSDIRNLLLSLLNRDRVYWLEDWFDSTSTVIFNANYIQNNPIMRAVMDRCLTNYIKLNPEQLRNKIQQSRTFSPDTTIWAKIRNNLFLKDKLSPEDMDKVFKVLNMIKIESLRDKWRYINIAECSIKVLGNLDFLTYFADIEILDWLQNNNDISRSDKVKLIAQEKGVSYRQARNIIRKTEVV